VYRLLGVSSLDRYRRLLRTPQMTALVVLGLVARLPIAVVPLAIVLFLRETTGSFATAGAVAAAFALAAGLSAPLQGRAIDRRGQSRLLVPFALVNAAALAGVIALGLGGAPPVAIAGAAAVAGGAMPPISACFRSVMVDLLEGDQELLRAGYAIDSLAIEGVFILGPLLTALVVAAASPEAALAAGALLGLGPTAAFAALPASRAWRGEHAGGGRAGALASPGVRTLALTALPIGICFGTLEVALPAFGAEHGAASIGGVLFAAMSLGSAAGGLAYGAAAERLGPLTRGYLLLVAALPLCFLLLLLPGSVAAMIVLVPFAGCVIAPLTAAENQIVAAVTPRGAGTEAYTWLIMSTVLGIAAGNAAAGAIVQAAGWREALLAACAAAALGAALSIARRATLRPMRAARG
jgi:MFS family permease